MSIHSISLCEVSDYILSEAKTLEQVRCLTNDNLQFILFIFPKKTYADGAHKSRVFIFQIIKCHSNALVNITRRLIGYVKNLRQYIL